MPAVEMQPFTEVFFRSVEAYKRYNNMLSRIDWTGHIAEFKMIFQFYSRSSQRYCSCRHHGNIDSFNSIVDLRHHSQCHDPQ